MRHHTHPKHVRKYNKPDINLFGAEAFASGVGYINPLSTFTPVVVSYRKRRAHSIDWLEYVRDKQLIIKLAHPEAH